MKKKLQFAVFLIVILSLSCCQSKQSVVESLPEDQNTAQLDNPLKISFEIEESSIDNLASENIGCIDDIKGYGFYLSIEGDKVSAVLPCFRAPQITNGYNPVHLTISSQTLEQFTYQRYQDPREFTIHFEVPDRNRRWNFELHVKPDKTAYLNVFSGTLPRAGYLGKVSSSI